MSVPQRKGDALSISEDEEPGRGDPSKFAKLKPAFSKDGTITAANASSINDGAAALVLASEHAVREKKLTPLARIVGYGSGRSSTRVVHHRARAAVAVTLSKLGLRPGDIDLWEINEAFSCVPMACGKLVGLDPERVNVNGGAVALGHPIGASGARILTTLVHALRARGARRGLATLCIGGGEAVAVVIEAV